MYVCMYVCTLATAYTVWASKLKFEPYSVHIIISNRIFCFFEMSICFLVILFFHFSQFSLYQSYEHTDYDNQWLKLKLCIIRTHCVVSIFIDWTVTSSNNVISFKIWTHVWYHISIVHNQRFTYIYIYIATKKSKHNLKKKQIQRRAAAETNAHINVSL